MSSSLEGGKAVLKKDTREIERMRAKFDSTIMAIKGVESISIGLNEQDKACLMLGTSIPVEQVRAKLPREIFNIPISIVYIGKIGAQ
ncbi:MAG: hypothetical protein L3K24_08830 [Gammaproteobacteria bacterium]|nr:hypothetical protein [Gammaproteobacteria bacterium]